MGLYREQRIVTRCEVEFERLGRRIQAVSEDLSIRGVFVRTEELLAVGAVVTLGLRMPGGEAVRAMARVAHVLTPGAARALGRRAGMGFEFLEHDSVGREVLQSYLDTLAEEVTSPRLDLPRQSFAIIADPNQQMLDRLENALGIIGFETLLYRDGAEALAACQELIPDLVLAAMDMPIMDGL